jgi:hypothetical protein
MLFQPARTGNYTLSIGRSSRIPVSTILPPLRMESTTGEVSHRFPDGLGLSFSSDLGLCFLHKAQKHLAVEGPVEPIAADSER